jgi:hypothetical protein
MISTNTTDILAHRLKRLAQSGLPAEELAANIQRLMEMERTEKLTATQDSEPGTLPFIAGRKAFLNVV